MIDTQNFLDTEIEQNLWDVEIDGIHLWAALREDAKRTLDQRETNYQTRQYAAPWQVLRPRLWQKHAHTLKFLKSSTTRSNFDTMVIIWGNDQIYNNIYQQIASPLILESSWFGQSNDDIWAKHSTILHDTFKIWGAIRAKVTKLPASQLRQVENFVMQVSQIFDLPEHRARYIKLVKNHIQRYHFLKPMIHGKLIPQLKTKTAFVSIAAYMARKAAWTQLLHEADITVIEAQHGFIGKDHIAYQYHQTTLHDSTHPTGLYMPDELWMFGQYWADVAQISSAKQIIGNPRLSNYIDAVEETVVTNDKQIIVISQWTVTQQLVDLAFTIAKALPEYKIVYKLHPLETTLPAKTFEILDDCSNVEIASGGDLYRLVAESGIVVGSYSTVLLEALAFPNKRIFNIRNHFIADNVMTTFETSDELIAYIQDGKSGYSKHTSSYYWESDPQQRITEALRQHKLI